jgi:hypothetical protein
MQPGTEVRPPKRPDFTYRQQANVGGPIQEAAITAALAAIGAAHEKTEDDGGVEP